MEKARLDRIRRLLEITKRERHHEVLPYAKNPHDLGASPFPYIVHVLPYPLSNEVVKDDHFFLSNLLKLLLGGSTHVEAIPKSLVHPDYKHFLIQDPKPGPPSGDKEQEV